jgi:thiol-disulfide isomerase/thioredoxin
MHRRKHLALGIVTLLALVTVAVAYARRQYIPGFILSSTARGSSEQPMSGDGSPVAPELAPGTWINSDPLTIKGLRGRVVLVDFWTFACYNCRNTLPYVKEWNARYRDKGLTIIGVHSPELDEERVLENVKRETAALGIRYPVVTDNDYSTWRAYGVEAWPTFFLVDKQGRIRWSHVGEGKYEEAEKIIRALIAE